jgi:streptogramin lyase
VITASGRSIKEYALPAHAFPRGITTGRGDAFWVTDENNDVIYRLIANSRFGIYID